MPSEGLAYGNSVLMKDEGRIVGVYDFRSWQWAGGGVVVVVNNRFEAESVVGAV